jgi:hypothetical protein
MSTFDDEVVGSILLLVFNAGMWESLEPEVQEKGQVLLQKLMDSGVELHAPEITSPRLSLSEYTNMIGSALDLTGLQSDFWIVVIKVCYLMMCAEKDPLFAQKLKESSNMGSYISEIFND